nr:ribonuclease H-like domain-containing protein [Tanacetum cinerariifolium]
MTPSTPPSYTFLDPTPFPGLNTLASAPTPPFATHETTQPNNTAIPNVEPNNPYGLTPQGPTPTEPSPSPQSTLPTSIAYNHDIPTSIAHNHDSGPSFSAHQSSIVKPIDRLSLHTSSISHIPKNTSHALKGPNWRNAMYDEYNALVKNGTWLLVPRPACVNMVRSMWLFKHKFHADGTLSRYMARLVANGSSQQQGVDFNETFSPIIKPATIRTVLSLVVSRQCPIHQLDVKNSFLNGDLSKTIYMHQPPGFVDARQGSHVAYLLIYVDDIILTASSPALLQQIIDSLHNEFDMTDLRALNYFLGISVDRNSTGLFLSQKKYALQLLERAHMVDCNPSRTPVDIESKLCPDSVPVQDPTLYRSLAGGYLCLYMHDPREPHFAALKCILRYVRGTVDFGLQLYAFATTSLVGYTDADWAGCPYSRMSTLGYCVFLGDNLLSWSAKRQHTLSRSSAEAEYHGVANVVAETAWLRNLLRELHYSLSTPTLVYCDNVSAVYMSDNPVQHQRIKHVKIDIHFVRDMVTDGQVRVLHVPSRYQYVDIFTKGLFSALFEEFRSSLSVYPPFAPTRGRISQHILLVNSYFWMIRL